MLTIPTPAEEWRRLSALRALGVLDTAPDPELDAITALAADLFEVPIALISLVDEERQWFKSRVGLDICETHRDIAFCGYTILSDDIFVVLDTHQDPRFRDHPLVLEAPHIRFYAAAPLILSGGERVGTLCIISPEPREQFSEREQRALRTLSRQVISFFENRRTLSEQRIARLIADTAPDAFVAADPLGEIIYWNRGAEALFGYSADEAIGQPLDIIVPAEHRGAHLAGMNRLRDGGVPRLVGKTIEVPAIRKDGSRVMVELTLGMWSDEATGVPTGFASIMRDVSHRLMTEQKLADQIAAIEAADEGISISSLDGIAHYMNAAYLNLFGLPANASGLPWSHVTASHERERMMAEAFPALRATGKWMGEVQGLSSDGRMVDCELSLTMTDKAVVAVVRDVSEKREALREQARLRETLLLMQRHEACGQMAAGLAHDFNNLIAAIGGSAALIEVQGNAEAQRHAQRIAQAARDAGNLVAKLLEGGRRDTDYQCQDVRGIVENVADLIEPSLARGHRIRLDVADGPVEAVVDRAEVMQVAMNLVLNARDASRDARAPEIVVAVDYDEAPPPDRIRVGVAPEGRCVRLRVEDNGVGIAADLIEPIFDPFYSRKSEGSGTGLGLAMVANIVSGAGGGIAVESEVGKGTRFDVFWPLEPPGRTGEPAAMMLEPSAQHALEGQTILLVDDKAAVTETLSALLEQAGAEVGSCTSAADALSALGEDPDAWTLLVTDFDMPDMNGAELATRARELRPDLPLLLVSALHDAPRVQAQCGSLFDAIGAKTASPAEFVRLAREAIEKARGRA